MMSVSKGLNVLLFPRFIKWRDSTSGHLEVPFMFNDLQTWILHLIQPLFLLTAFSSFSSSAKAIVPFLCDMPPQRYQMSSKTLIDTTRSAPNLFFWKDLKLGAMNVNTFMCFNNVFMHLNCQLTVTLVKLVFDLLTLGIWTFHWCV